MKKSVIGFIFGMVVKTHYTIPINDIKPILENLK